MFQDMTKKFDVPILFIIFNRPETTRKLFPVIKKVRPTRLFIAADGPRENRNGEKEKCEEVRKITEDVDWLCTVKRLYRDKNLGCKIAVSGAINWFFQNVEEGIILEDDCLPDLSFFTYCKILLEKYRDNSRVMHIGGNNFQHGIHRGEKKTSYYFSKYPHIWGWATWKRAWNKYSLKVDMKDQRFKEVFSEMSIFERIYWGNLFWAVNNNFIDSWGYQWAYTCWANGGVAITPNKNLVLNIGFDEEATHSKKIPGYLSGIGLEKIERIIHPQTLGVDREADEYTWKNVFGGNYKNFLRSLMVVPYFFKQNM